MKRTPVDSTSIAAIGYHPRSRTLEIEFRESGEVYRYAGVSEREQSDFMAAPSKGSYLNQVFKPKAHRYEVVRKRNT